MWLIDAGNINLFMSLFVCGKSQQEEEDVFTDH